MNTNLNKCWLASVGAGRWQMAGIAAAQRAGLRVLALDSDARASGLEVADAGIVVDIRDTTAVIDAVINSGISLDGAAAFAAEAGMRALGALRDHFGLPGPGLEVLGTLSNKAKQRRAWHDAGLANPRFWREVATIEAGLDAIADADSAVLVKPVDSAGSRGITRLGTNARPVQRQTAIEVAFTASTTRHAIVESVLPGREYTVETFGDGTETHVLAVTVKRKVPGTEDTVADELASPDEDSATIEAISDLARQALESVRYREGPGHVEVMQDPGDGPALIEAAGRGGGFLVFERLVPLASGYDIVTASALQAVGQTPPPVGSDRRAVLIRFFPSRPGRVRGFSGFEDAAMIHGVEAGSFVNLGDETSAAASDGDRLGYILTSGATPQQARARADAAEQRISFDIELVK